jgi:hypothetical protein
MRQPSSVAVARWKRDEDESVLAIKVPVKGFEGKGADGAHAAPRSCWSQLMSTSSARMTSIKAAQSRIPSFHSQTWPDQGARRFSR